MRQNIAFKWFLLGGALLLALILMGCGGGGGNKAGSTAFYLTDAASDTYEHVYISVDSVQIHTESGWVTVASNLGRVDLLSPQFQFHQQLIGSAPLAPGHYDQTRLVLSKSAGANQVVLKGQTTPLDLVIPSSAQTGLKLVGGFDVAAGQGQAIVIDFAPDKMIHTARTGNGTRYMMRPTCPIISLANAPEMYGGLIGKVMPSGAWETAVVTAYQPQTGAVVAVTAVTQPDLENPSDSDGTFRLALPAGEYGLKITAQGYTLYDSTTATPATWTVSAGADTDSGVATLTTEATP